MANDSILIVDFGSQVTQLIARRIREVGVYCEIEPFHKAELRLATLNPKGIILSGGPASVTAEDAPKLPPALLAANLPILAICYGQQALNVALGGTVTGGKTGEFGRAEVEIVAESPLLPTSWTEGSAQPVWMSHGDAVSKLAPGFEVLGRSRGAPFAMTAHQEKHLYGVQFHPEVVHTPDGEELLHNFVLKVCQCHATWSMRTFKARAISKIRVQVSNGKVICGLSGGVDSTVTAVLLHQAIGDRLTCVFVDHGLMRKNEAEEVVTLFRDEFGIPLIHVNAAEAFLEALEGISDPETKRKIIGKMFIEIFDQEASKIEGVTHLAQGTLYPDVVESVSVSGGPSVTIKSHHNVGGLPQKMKLRLVEPLRELFKDEVRRLGSELNIPAAFLGRHPFPGPGLAIRIPGTFQKEKLPILQEADAIYIEELRKAGLYDEIWQAFSVLLPVQSVGVMGDGRTYEQVLALRAVTSKDGMTADFYPFDMAFLGQVSSRIVNEVKGINRVVYDITSKPPGTIEWE